MKDLSPRAEYRKANRKRWDAMENHLDRLIRLRDTLEPGDRVLLVGQNATGKSLFRGLISGKTLKTEKLTVVHASMALRTENSAGMGALAGMFSDRGYCATSTSSLSLVERAVSNCATWVSNGKACALHIDEPEVGCSDELQMSLGPWLRDRLDAVPTKLTMVTTHSPSIASNFKDWKFIDTGFRYKSAEEWLARKIEPLDIEELKLNARALFLVIVERQEQNK